MTEPKLIREGTCQPEKCGGSLCCKLGPWLKEVPDDPDEIRFIEGFGWEKVGEYKGDLIYSSMQTCQHLMDGKCMIYDNRPKICDDFPNRKDKLFWEAVRGRCTFNFKQGGNHGQSD